MTILERNMLTGYETERQDCLRNLRSSNPSVRQRARNRLAVIEDSIKQLEYMRTLSSTGAAPKFGGYGESELERYRNATVQ